MQDDINMFKLEKRKTIAGKPLEAIISDKGALTKYCLKRCQNICTFLCFIFQTADKW